MMRATLCLSVLAKCQRKYTILHKVLDFKIQQQGVSTKAWPYKEELEWSDLFSLERILSFLSITTKKHQIEAVCSNWKSLHWVCWRANKTTNCKGWHNYTWYLPKNRGRKWTDTTQNSLKIRSSLFSVWFLKGLHRNPI